MIVLSAVIGAVYAAVLIPFKVFTIIPGLTEMRPAAALPVVVSLFFGPAGAFGVAFGNLIGDFAGTLGWGSIFGVVGNFLLGYLPHKIILPRDRGYLTRPIDIPVYIAVSVVTAAACAAFIGWGVDLLGLAPFAVVANIIIVNNVCFMLVLSPLLVKALEKRVKRQNLMYYQVMEVKPERPKTHILGVAFLVCGSFLGLLAGNLLQLGLVNGGFTISTALIPFIILILVGAALV